MNKRDFVKQKYIRYFINIISKQNATQTRFSGIKRKNFQKFEAFPRKTPVWQLRVKSKHLLYLL